MPPHAAPPPPPPRPDPVTLDQILTHLTAADVAYDTKAYHLVALSTVAFHPSVKLFLYEDPTVATRLASSSSPQAAAALHKWRRENMLKSVAFMLAQRNNAICYECRWETVSLLGELCRMESTHSGAPTSALGQLEAKLNNYAKQNLEYLAQLPWFVPAINGIIEAGGGAVDDDVNGDASVDVATATKVQRQGESGSSVTASSSRSALKEKLKAGRGTSRNGRGGANRNSGAGAGTEEEDEDVVVALLDIRRALPTCHRGSCSGNNDVVVEWSEANVEQARDLMFVDASTSMLHLIPSVARGYSDVCAQCQKRVITASTPLLRCSSCKAVYYCSAECQKMHWATVHRTPCRAYKERCDRILEQYYAPRRTGGKRQKDLKTGEVVILEVPLEPSLFFETRRYLYDHRDESFAHVSYSDYFMKYTIRGS